MQLQKTHNPIVSNTRYTAYTLAAMAYMHMHKAQGEVIYNNLDPDTTLETNGAYYELDVNSDGLNDFAFSMLASTYYGSYYGNDATFKKLGVFVSPLNENAIAGFDGAGGVYPLRLNPNVEVGPYAFSAGSFFNDFYTADQQILAYQDIRIVTYYSGYISNYVNDPAGEWNTGINKFMGIALNQSGETFFGWVRLNVYAGSENLYCTIRDAAYETEPDIPITTFYPQNSINQQSEPPAEIFAIENIVHVILPNISSGKQSVNIYNLSGQLIQTQVIMDLHTTIELTDIASGNYIIQLVSNDAIVSEQVFVKN